MGRSYRTFVEADLKVRLAEERVLRKVIVLAVWYRGVTPPR